LVPGPSCGLASAFSLNGFDGKIYATDYANSIFLLNKSCAWISCKEKLMIVEARINELLTTMTEGWRRGSGTLFAQPFSKDAHFVAFDGSVHNGPSEIAVFHQVAFDTVLKGTSLDLSVSETRQIDQKTWLVFAKGWHRPNDAADDKRRAESVNIFVCKLDGKTAEVLAFQNTRVRPITDQASADIWKAFDTSWESRKITNT
jgi:uncharacterized protein (TIGR02246 family)